MSPTFGVIIDGAGSSLRDVESGVFIETFKTHGAVLLRNFASTVDDFVALTGKVCHDFSTYRGGGFRWGPLDRESIGGNTTLMTVTGAGQGWPIALHGEMYYLKQRPTMLWFYCQQAPARDGQTTLCDGEAAFTTLAPSTRDMLRNTNVKYVRRLGRDEWPTTFQTNDENELAAVCADNDLRLKIKDDGSIETEFVTPAVVRSRGRGREALINNIVQMYTIEWAFESGWVKQHLPNLPRDTSPMVVRLEDDSKVPSALFDELRDNYEQHTINVQWQTGDVLLADNTRLLHGRREATDPNRNILVRMGEPAFAW